MTDELVFTSVMCVAAVCGAIAGRIFALEAENRRTAVFAAAYCGAGAGLVSAPPLAFTLMLIARLWSSQPWTSALFDAAEATGAAMLWGIAGGAAGGLLLGVLVAAFKTHPPPS